LRSDSPDANVPGVISEGEARSDPTGAALERATAPPRHILAVHISPHRSASACHVAPRALGSSYVDYVMCPCLRLCDRTLEPRRSCVVDPSPHGAHANRVSGIARRRAPRGPRVGLGVGSRRRLLATCPLAVAVRGFAVSFRVHAPAAQGPANVVILLYSNVRKTDRLYNTMTTVVELTSGSWSGDSCGLHGRWRSLGQSDGEAIGTGRRSGNQACFDSS